MNSRVLLVCVGALLIGTTVVDAGDVYAFNLRADNYLMYFPANDPANRTIIPGVLPYDTYTLDFDSNATTLYCVNITSGEFGTIGLTDGAFTGLAALTGVGTGETTVGLRVDPTNETFYLATNGGGVNRLYNLDPVTAVATLVTALSGGSGNELFIDIAIDAAGQMYGHDIANDALYAIDKSTGVVTLIGATGLAANFAQGMDFDYATNTLYATLYSGAGSGRFVSLSTTTGAATVLYDTTTWNIEAEMAVKSAIPEPSSVLLLALGGLTLLRRR
jgi:TM2 domain-containing membrane protein YozV